ncbi:hypothetical protein [Flavobacterium sp. ov086]|uniref:hypothetical protein n=1 Tax=Flavobacterium sp. ov086 TaxID=1761785 RepID=UPI000B7835D4|nr:hypothetical protein [Flavobacterium sp. ov086]
MKKIIWLILVTTFISCSSSKTEMKVINDFLNKELKTDKSSVVLVEESLPKIKALQYYENAYNERNLYEGEIRFAPNGYPPYTWEIDSIEIAVLKKEVLKDTITYHWKESDFKDQKLKIIPYKTIKKRGSRQLGENGIYLSKPLITTDKKHAFLFYRSFAVEIGFSDEKAVLLKKVNGIWVELNHYNNVMEIN